MNALPQDPLIALVTSVQVNVNVQVILLEELAIAAKMAITNTQIANVNKNLFSFILYLKIILTLNIF